MAFNPNRQPGEELAQDLAGGLKKGAIVLLKAAAIVIGLAVVGGIAGGFAAGAAAVGGLAKFGMVVGGILLGGYTGQVVAANFVMKKAEKLIVGAGKFVDDINKEMAKQAPVVVAPQPAPVATAEAQGAFNATATNDNTQAQAAPAAAPAAPAAAPKQNP
jgi:hypothetical protein